MKSVKYKVGESLRIDVDRITNEKLSDEIWNLVIGELWFKVKEPVNQVRFNTKLTLEEEIELPWELIV